MPKGKKVVISKQDYITSARECAAVLKGVQENLRQATEMLGKDLDFTGSVLVSLDKR